MGSLDFPTVSSLPALFMHRAEERGGAVLFRKRHNDELVTITWEQALDKMRRIAAGLVRWGLKPGDRVATMAENGPELSLCDLAIQTAGGVVVPIYTTSTAEQIRYILAHSECSFIFFGKPSFQPRIENALSSMEAPPAQILMEDIDEPLAASVQALNALLEEPPTREELGEVEKRMAALERGDLSVIIYTSGTTGPPKGVMLTQGNILANVEAALLTLPLNQEDVFLSFLPMSHSFERSMGHYAVLAAGAQIHYARSLGTVPKDFLEAAPTVAMVVPRFLEKIHQRVRYALKEKSLPVKLLLHAVLSLGLKKARRERAGEPVPILLQWITRAAERTVLKKLQDRLGGRLRFLVSGGAALSVELWDFFTAAGIRVLQGYGLTETSPVVSVNPLQKNKPESVGPPIENMSVRCAPDGEIEVSGPSLMKGYWKQPEATAAMFTGDGWLKTGDVGKIDEEGYIYITDRKKDIIVSSSGKNIAPQNIENTLCMDGLVEYACILGDGQRYLGALISPNLEVLAVRLESQGIDVRDPALLAEDPRVVNLYQGIIDRVNRHLPPHERILRFRLVKRPFSQEGGEITPTLKVRRKQIQTLYGDEIDSLFQGKERT